METIKEKVEFIRKNNKRALIIAGIAWKIVATMIMVEKCNEPQELPDTIKQKTEQSK